MINILEKKTEKWWLDELSLLGPQAIRELIAEEVQLAFKAGMCHTNVLTRTLNPYVFVDAGQKEKPIESVEHVTGVMELGVFKLLPDLYLQHKGLI